MHIITHKKQLDDYLSKHHLLASMEHVLVDKRFWAVLGIAAVVGVIILLAMLSTESATGFDTREIYPFYPLP